MKLDPQADVIRRLRCAAGHLHAVIEMAEEGQPCEALFHQINAVEAALRAAELRLVALHIHASGAVILTNTSPAQRSVELKRLLDLYSIMLHKANQIYEVSK